MRLLQLEETLSITVDLRPINREWLMSWLAAG
jgi:hypothetical protein